MKTLSIPSYETKSAGKNVERLKKPLTRLQVKKHVLEMGEKFGLDSPRRNSRLADCLVNFSAAPDLTALRRFKKDLEFIASTKPGGSPLEEKIPARELFQLKTDIHNVIVWALDEKPKDTQKHKDKSVQFSMITNDNWPNGKTRPSMARANTSKRRISMKNENEQALLGCLTFNSDDTLRDKLTERWRT
jgi:hypothetical protein